MARGKLLSTNCIQSVPGEYYKSEVYYNRDFPNADVNSHYKEYVTTVVFSCAVTALPVNTDTEVDRYTDAAGRVVILYYTGGSNGYVRERFESDAPSGGDLSVSLTVYHPTTERPPDGQIVAHCSSTKGPIRVSVGQVSVVSIGFGPTEFDGNLWGLSPGIYRVFVEDAVGNRYQSDLIELVLGGIPTENDDIFFPVWLKYVAGYEEFENGGQYGTDRYYENFYTGTAWSKVRREVYTIARFNLPESYSVGIYEDFSQPTDVAVDSYRLEDGSGKRRYVYHDGEGGVIFVDVEPTDQYEFLGKLQVTNVIVNDVDDTGDENGNVLIEIDSPTYPVTFTLNNGATSTTGQFSDLPAGAYTCTISNGEDTITEPFTITDCYRVRWTLDYDDIHSQTLQTRILQRDWAGTSTKVCGSGNPVTTLWDDGSDPSALLRESQGSSMTLNLVTDEFGQFQDLQLGDERAFRIDHYRSGKLVFRGYVSHQSYTESLVHAQHNEVTITATDGLGTLKEYEFVSYREGKDAQIMRDRRCLLHTILHILSRCDTNFPVYVGLRLRDELMSASEDVLLQTYARRDAYVKAAKEGEEAEAAFCRDVLDAILKSFAGFLFVRDGAFWLLDLNAVHESYELFAYKANGESLGTIQMPAPLHILPQSEATELDVFWINAEQEATTVPAAKVIKSTVNLQPVENQVENGDFAAWSQVQNTLVPDGWEVVGTHLIGRAAGTKKDTYTVRMELEANAASQSTEIGLLSLAVPHLPGGDEELYQLTIKARTQEPYVPYNANTKPVDTIVEIRVEIYDEGFLDDTLIVFRLSSADKEKELKSYLPTGLTGNNIRIRILQPVLILGQNLPVFISSVSIKMFPGVVEFPKTDFVYVTNPLPAFEALENVELVHADLPRLPDFEGNPEPVVGMSIYHWRHALSTAGYQATTVWKRPGDTGSGYSLLETAGLDRISLRAKPVTTIHGSVAGGGFAQIGVGRVLDITELDGQYLITGCELDHKQAVARVTLRLMHSGKYASGLIEYPAGTRFTHLGARYTDSGYRTTEVDE